MKSAEETKKGLECCAAHDCNGCGYNCGASTCIDSLLKDISSLIQQLEAKAPRWISVEERLPEERLCVSVYIQEDGGAYWIETAFRRDGKWRIQGEYVIDRNITNWMHLPEPPEA